MHEVLKHSSPCSPVKSHESPCDSQQNARTKSRSLPASVIKWRQCAFKSCHVQLCLADLKWKNIHLLRHIRKRLYISKSPQEIFTAVYFVKVSLKSEAACDQQVGIWPPYRNCCTSVCCCVSWGFTSVRLCVNALDVFCYIFLVTIYILFICPFLSKRARHTQLCRQAKATISSN